MWKRRAGLGHEDGRLKRDGAVSLAGSKGRIGYVAPDERRRLLGWAVKTTRGPCDEDHQLATSGRAWTIYCRRGGILKIPSWAVPIEPSQDMQEWCYFLKQGRALA